MVGDLGQLPAGNGHDRAGSGGADRAMAAAAQTGTCL
jgi:hypothetical protein